jgi:hypothetical protein
MPERQPGSSALSLALAYVVLVLYASLYPFEGWRWPPGQSLWALAVLPRSVYHDPFDIISNLLGYLPLGALLGIALRRPWHANARGLDAGRVGGSDAFIRLRGAAAVCAAARAFAGRPGHEHRRCATGCAAGHGHASPGPGCAAGSACASAGLAVKAPAPWRCWACGRWACCFRRRCRWAWARSASVCANGLADLLQGVPWAETAYALLAEGPTAVPPLRPLAEVLIVALGLLAPCLVAYAVMAPGLRRRRDGTGRPAAGGAGHDGFHLAELRATPCAGLAHTAQRPGPGGGHLLLALLLALLPRRVAPGLGLVVLTGPGGGRGPGAGRPLLCAKPAGLGAGALCALPRPGAVGRLAVALCRDGLAAVAPGRTHRVRGSGRLWPRTAGRPRGPTYNLRP